ncbi:hypothetical protein DEU56DRAFT_756379 [Suillus clintonianus]|uniref:uncharacterized protein n=1 Tax=Suillus clintonianus TaxID=1904413 RepID=UPI001B87EFC1|nr:uncharacterized protein DEU56DRAFT_756379 [Suillus clintonianus]KAG2135964.1 hypothetical protein DEU56DRAFT_756379 [Suillus clintonianus]
MSTAISSDPYAHIKLLHHFYDKPGSGNLSEVSEDQVLKQTTTKYHENVLYKVKHNSPWQNYTDAGDYPLYKVSVSSLMRLSKLKILVADRINRELKPDLLVDSEDKYCRGFVNDCWRRLRGQYLLEPKVAVIVIIASPARTHRFTDAGLTVVDSASSEFSGEPRRVPPSEPGSEPIGPASRFAAASKLIQGNWHGYPSSDGDGSTPSHPQLPQLPQGNTAPASRFSHPMAGGGQHQPGGVVAPDPSLWQYRTGGSYPTFGPQSHLSTVRAFPQALSNQFHHSTFNLAQNAPRGPALSPTIPHPTSSDPTTSQANHASGYHNPQHEDLAGVNHPIPQFNPRTAAAALSAYDYFRIPMAISQNFPTTLTLTPFDSSTSLAAPTQSSSTALGACSPNDQGHLLSFGAKDVIRRLVEKRPIKRKVARAHKQIKFITAKIPSASTQSTPNTSLLHIDSSLVDSVKEDATRLMILSLFQKSLYPATDDITTLANTALDEAITKHTHNGICPPPSYSSCDSRRTWKKSLWRGNCGQKVRALSRG